VDVSAWVSVATMDSIVVVVVLKGGNWRVYVVVSMTTIDEVIV
jgi:hypothetical protein